MQETSYVWRFRVPPGWLAAPAGWWPPYGWVPDPRWPPAPPGWAFWELVPVIRGPRARGLRVTILAAFFVSLAVGLLAMIVGILLWFERGIERSDYSSDYAYDVAICQAWGRAGPYILSSMGLALLAMLALLAFLAPRAGYRRFTILLLLIPVYGAVVAARIMWRWTDIGGWERRHSSTSPGPSAEALVPARL